MEFKQLRALVMVADELNFTRAAARLNTSQQNLSKQIGALEWELKVALFIRTARGAALTVLPPTVKAHPGFW